MKEKILRGIESWFLKLFEIIKKDPLQKTVLIFVLPIIINAMAKAILEFSVLSAIGYYFACIYGFSSALEDPYRVIKWGVGYVIGAIAVKMVFENMIPAFDPNNAVSIVSVLVIGYVVIQFYLKSRELKKS
jgi:RsiW-degrading membrane proteinase PrsW (M82 family)